MSDYAALLNWNSCAFSLWFGLRLFDYLVPGNFQDTNWLTANATYLGLYNTCRSYRHGVYIRYIIPLIDRSPFSPRPVFPPVKVLSYMVPPPGCHMPTARISPLWESMHQVIAGTSSFMVVAGGAALSWWISADAAHARRRSPPATHVHKKQRGMNISSWTPPDVDIFLVPNEAVGEEIGTSATRYVMWVVRLVLEYVRRMEGCSSKIYLTTSTTYEERDAASGRESEKKVREVSVETMRVWASTEAQEAFRPGTLMQTLYPCARPAFPHASHSNPFLVFDVVCPGLTTMSFIANFEVYLESYHRRQLYSLNPHVQPCADMERLAAISQIWRGFDIDICRVAAIITPASPQPRGDPRLKVQFYLSNQVARAIRSGKMAAQMHPRPYDVSNVRRVVKYNLRGFILMSSTLFSEDLRLPQPRKTCDEFLHRCSLRIPLIFERLRLYRQNPKLVLPATDDSTASEIVYDLDRV